MRMHKRLELSHSEEWQGFKMQNQHLELPTGQLVSPQEVLAGIALLDIQSELEINTTTKLLKYVRAIVKIRT